MKWRIIGIYEWFSSQQNTLLHIINRIISIKHLRRLFQHGFDPAFILRPFVFWRFCILFIPHPLHSVSITLKTLNKRRSLLVYLDIADPAFNRECSTCMKLRLAAGCRVRLTTSGACLIHNKRVRNINNCPPNDSKPLSDRECY